MIQDRLMEYLASEYNPVDVKMAVINQLGWKISGRNNSEPFLRYILRKRGHSSANRFLKKGRADDLISYAYLKAMDDYFKVDESQISVYAKDQWSAPPASGSSVADGMVVCPCTTGSLARAWRSKKA